MRLYCVINLSLRMFIFVNFVTLRNGVGDLDEVSGWGEVGMGFRGEKTRFLETLLYPEILKDKIDYTSLPRQNI